MENKLLLAQNSVRNPILNGSYNGVSFFQSLVPAIISFGLVVGAVVFMFMLILGAIQWISSGGDKVAVEAARGRVANALIGLVVLFALFAIISVVNILFNINLLLLNLDDIKL